MPEGHSVHRIARRFTEVFAGRCVAASSPQGRFEAGAALLDGQSPSESYAVGKHLFVPFESGQTLRVHLGIYGAWDFAFDAGAFDRIGQTGEYSLNPAGRVLTPHHRSIGAPRKLRVGETESSSELMTFPPDPVGAVRLRLLSSEVCADLRGPTACEVMDPHEVEAKILTLGPDPLVEPGDEGLERFARKIGRKGAPIAQVLMDQGVIAGIGNIYRAEMLFRARMDPFRPARSLSDDELEALWEDWTQLLALGVETGVILTRDLSGDEYEDSLTSLENRHWVYGRAGAPCRVCATEIALTELQNRKLYWCPQCQS